VCCGTGTRHWLRWRGSPAIANDPSTRQRRRPTTIPLLSHSKMNHVMGPSWVPDTKTDWPNDRRPYAGLMLPSSGCWKSRGKRFVFLPAVTSHGTAEKLSFTADKSYSLTSGIQGSPRLETATMAMRVWLISAHCSSIHKLFMTTWYRTTLAVGRGMSVEDRYILASLIWMNPVLAYVQYPWYRLSAITRTCYNNPAPRPLWRVWTQ
jgi:hypothetical protein